MTPLAPGRERTRPNDRPLLQFKTQLRFRSGVSTLSLNAFEAISNEPQFSCSRDFALLLTVDDGAVTRLWLSRAVPESRDDDVEVTGSVQQTGKRTHWQLSARHCQTDECPTKVPECRPHRLWHVSLGASTLSSFFSLSQPPPPPPLRTLLLPVLPPLHKR